MEKLWAPWRMNYIKKIDKEKGCLFCKAFEKGNDSARLIAYRTDTAVVMLNKYPYNNGHLMIAPKRHTGKIEQLTAPELSEIMDLSRLMVTAMKKIMNPDGFNIGMNIGRTAGAGIEKHLHLHIVPRWNGDTNFMPVCGQTKIISQSLEAFYKELKKCLKELT